MSVNNNSGCQFVCKEHPSKPKFGCYFCSKAAHQNKALSTPPTWMTIESAPKDGEFLAFGFYFYPGDKSPTIYYSIAERNGEFIEDWEGKHPAGFFTHWLPLPLQPKENSDE